MAFWGAHFKKGLPPASSNRCLHWASSKTLSSNLVLAPTFRKRSWGISKRGHLGFAWRACPGSATRQILYFLTSNHFPPPFPSTLLLVSSHPTHHHRPVPTTPATMPRKIRRCIPACSSSRRRNPPSLRSRGRRDWRRSQAD
jgi:hypothetical protein